MAVAATGTIAEERGKTMPGRDKTGPEGRGSMTGRGLGSCVGSERAGGLGYGRGYGRGRGRGVGRGCGGGRGLGFGGGRRFGSADDAEIGNEPRDAALLAEPSVTSSLVAQIARLTDQMRALEARLTESKPEE